jgi:hypothetical protein
MSDKPFFICRARVRRTRRIMLNHTYSLLGVEVYKQTSTEKLSTGDVSVKLLFEADAPVPGSGGKVTLWANDK